jgi:hypothetical protein
MSCQNSDDADKSTDFNRFIANEIVDLTIIYGIQTTNEKFIREWYLIAILEKQLGL